MFLCLCAFFLVTSCAEKEAESIREPAIRPVKLLSLEPSTGQEVFRFPAVIGAAQYADLSFSVGGLLEEVSVVESGEVGQGDIIALASARAQFEAAQSEYERAVRLQEGGAIAASVLEQRETQKNVAKSQLDTAEKRLADSVLRAPFSGSVARITAMQSQNVAAGQVVATLINLDSLEVSIDMPATLVAESQEIENRGSYVILDAAPDARIPVRLKEARQLADSVSQTYRLTGTFEARAGLMILPGMNATVEIHGARQSASTNISVPLSAIARDGSARYVWIVDPDTMIVTRRDVTIVDGIGDTAIVTEGLAVTDTIAVSGAAFLADGMQVRPWND
jgi:RND family efflux transporter MFP subunit